MHWTQTPEGRKRMVAIRIATVAARRAKIIANASAKTRRTATGRTVPADHVYVCQDCDWSGRLGSAATYHRHTRPTHRVIIDRQAITEAIASAQDSPRARAKASAGRAKAPLIVSRAADTAASNVVAGLLREAQQAWEEFQEVIERLRNVVGSRPQ